MIYFFLALLTLILIPYGLYYISLICIHNVYRPQLLLDNSKSEHTFSFIISAYNEENNIKSRIQNIISLGIPVDLFQIIVISDGSTDSTASIAKNYDCVKVLENKHNMGRSYSHNLAVRKSFGSILIFTDCSTIFHDNYITETIQYFNSSNVGLVVGNLRYLNQNSNYVSSNENYYWKLEKSTRQLESDLGVLSTSTGACMAVRKSLYRPIDPTGDVDFITPIDVILQGFLNIYSPSAIAYDYVSSSLNSEIRTRSRQTAKNFYGTIKRLITSETLSKPSLIITLLFHKIIRWLSPITIILIYFVSIYLIHQSEFFFLFFIIQNIFYILSIIGYLLSFTKVNFKIFSMPLSFVTVKIGIFLGILLILDNKIPSSYDPERN